MAKRFTDTDKYKKPFFRNLPGAYKLLWDYLYHACDHAGIWIVDFEVAQIYLGQDMPVNKQKALELFNKDEKRIVVLNCGSKWFLPSFIDFQYGRLNDNNRAHKSVISILKKYNLHEGIKPLASPLQGASKGAKDKEQEQDKDKVKDKEKDIAFNPAGFTESQVADTTYVVGLTDAEAVEFFHHYNAQGWKRKNGQQITNLRSAMESWKNKQPIFKTKQKESVSDDKNTAHKCLTCSSVETKQFSNGVWLCETCLKYLNNAPKFVTFNGKTIPNTKLNKSQIEIQIEKGKALRKDKSYV